ncbi:MAG: XisH family protein [Chthonomonadaceae bacterium]|nr:XisH family protein [Chthonomonadaceae bacterium]
MAARDKYRNAVRNALIKEGWTITQDPYRISIGSTDVQVDLGAEQSLAAERNETKIAVEIKSFLNDSELYDLENALGQYSLYRLMLLKREPERLLYLDVPHTIRSFLMEQSDFRYILRELKVRLIIYRAKTEEIIEWIEFAHIAP